MSLHPSTYTTTPTTTTTLARGCPCRRPRPPHSGPSQVLGIITHHPPPPGSYVGLSSCNTYTTMLGSGQNVLSYSYYSATINTTTPLNTRYLELLDTLLEDMVTLYPGWRMRLYHNVTQKDPSVWSYLCSMYCTHPHLDLCNTRQLPAVGDLQAHTPVGRLWRFQVLGDPTVRLFGVRDIDSYILRRERDAVEDWERRKDKQFIVMRDSPQTNNGSRLLHGWPISAGLWGGNNYVDYSLARRLRSRLYGRIGEEPQADQRVLKYRIWPLIRSSSAVYDSYHCRDHRKEFGFGRPWPTRRRGSLYVGSGPSKGERIKELAQVTCPVICRPKEHKNWLFC